MTDSCGPPPADTHIDCEETLQFAAAPGENNDVTRTGAGTVRDAGAPLRAGRGCRQVDDHTVTCPALYLDVQTLDGDDRVVVGYPAGVLLGDGDDYLDGGGVASAKGGAGNDVMIGGTYVQGWDGGEGDDLLSVSDANNGAYLLGGPGDDRLEGGSGSDRIAGGAGADTIAGGPGDDRLDASDWNHPMAIRPTADHLDGGDGRDAVVYNARGAALPVTVDLAGPGGQGAAGEGDALTSIESAVGTGGNDVLRGDEHDNTLAGGPGDDRLEGGDGADDLEGGNGFDSFAGGPGDDLVRASASILYYNFLDSSYTPQAAYAAENRNETVECGDGADRVFVDSDVAAPDCEAFAEAPLYPDRVAIGKATFRLACQRSLLVRRRCRGTLSLSTVDGRATRRVPFVLRPGGGAVSIRLPAGVRTPSRLWVAKSYQRAGSPRALYRYAIDLPAGS
jgi:Ca2+-binding RTX toxin-like protein